MLNRFRSPSKIQIILYLLRSSRHRLTPTEFNSLPVVFQWPKLRLQPPSPTEPDRGRVAGQALCAGRSRWKRSRPPSLSLHSRCRF